MDHHGPSTSTIAMQIAMHGWCTYVVGLWLWFISWPGRAGVWGDQSDNESGKTGPVLFNAAAELRLSTRAGIAKKSVCGSPPSASPHHVFAFWLDCVIKNPIKLGMQGSRLALKLFWFSRKKSSSQAWSLIIYSYMSSIGWGLFCLGEFGVYQRIQFSKFYGPI
jgi:hypothetical protein